MYNNRFIESVTGICLACTKYRKSERFLGQTSVRYTLAIRGTELHEFADSDEIDNFPYLP